MSIERIIKENGLPTIGRKALLTVLDAPNPPGHLLLGSDAVRLVAAARSAVDEEIATWRDLSLSTDFPDGKVVA